MKKDWLAAIFAAFSIILDAIVKPFRDFVWEEKEILNGAEHDTEADQEQGSEAENS